MPDAAPSRWRASPARLVRLVAGLVLFGAGEGLLVHSNLGNSPWSVLAEGIADRIGVPIGTTTIAISALLLLSFRPLGQRIGLGTLSNAVIIGVGIDVVLEALGPTSDLLAVRGLEVVATLVLVSVGSGLYLTAHLGPGARDGLMTGLAARTGRSIRSTRFAIEITVCVAGAGLGGTIGVGTVAFALLIGPGVQLALARRGAPSAKAAPKSAPTSNG